MSEYILKNFISENINALSPDISTGDPVHFVVGFREDDGSEVRLDEKDFDRISADSNETVFSGRKRFQTLKIRIFRQSNENTLSIKAEVSGVPEDLILEYIEPLNTIINSSGNSLLLALNEGVLIDLEKGNPVSATPGWHYHSFYPGQTQAQFMAVINNSGCGVYIGAHDKSQSTKCFECTPGENGTYILSVRYYCGDNRTDGIYTIPDELVFNSFNGDWMDAAAIYRCWMEQNIEMPPKYDFPDFIKESPVILIHPVQGQGKDRAQMTENEYFPYKNAMPVIEKYADSLDSRIMSLLMHWEGTAPWAPPYVWPPLGGEEILAEYRDLLHAAGHTLGVYCSGTAWTQFSTIHFSYSRKEQFEREHLAREMIRGPHSELEAYLCNGWDQQRFGFDMCMKRQWAKDTVRKELAKMADFGFDYIQFFDQNIGGAAHCCWGRDHGHPPVPGVWQVDNMKEFLTDLKREFPDLVLGCEAAAAEPYLRFLKFNDLRFHWNIRHSKPVPLYAFLYHEYINNFMGNQCGLNYHLNFTESPHNLLWRIAYSFHAGDLLSLVLRNAGHIVWGWTTPWEDEQPDEEPVITLVRNLNSLRKKYPEFLSRGRMIKPPFKVTGDKWTLSTKNRGLIEHDSFFTSAWLSPEGKTAQFIINFLPYKQKVTMEKDGNKKLLELPELNAMIIN